MSAAGLFSDFTVAIPTYNGAKRIADVLERLRWQLGTERITWEVIVVNNNSTDDTEAVVRRFQKGWPELRYAFEPRQGAAHARQKAIRLARSPLVGFLDDDNLPSAIWVNQAYKFASQHPKMGAVGSRIQGQFSNCQPPANFERIAAFLALTERGPSPIIYHPGQKILPPGAGLVIRRSAWLAAVNESIELGVRVGNRDVAEDLEPVRHIQKAGWEVWYNPSMRVEHKIPAQRLTREYLCSLMRGIGLSRYRTRMLGVNKHWRYPLLLAYAVNDIRKMVRHLIKHRAATWQDPVTVSEMTLYLYSLLSPAFFLHLYLKQRWADSSLIAAIAHSPQVSVQDQNA